MTFLCALEAVNLDNMFGDCEDLNTTRGGGLAVLEIGAEVAKLLGVEALSSGSSQGLLLVEGNSPANIERMVRAKLAELAEANILKHATIMVEACEYDENSFAQQKAGLHSAMRWSQMRSPSVVYPELHGALVCNIDKVRPARPAHDLEEKRYQSDFTRSRRKCGRERKNTLVAKILSGAGKFDVVSDFAELAADKNRRFGNLADKLAVLRFDGNDFGDIGRRCVTLALTKKFSETTQRQHEDFFRALLSTVSHEWWTAHSPPKLRLEIVAYGGDEVTFVTPAWLGWKALRVFYEQAGTWPLFQLPDGEQRLTYGGGLVFCHRNAPIHAIKSLASGLAEHAKDRAKKERGAKGNFAVYQALESFDAIGEDLEDFLARRYRFAEGRGVFLGLDEIKLMDDNMEYWRTTLSRRKLHALAQGLERGDKVDVEQGIAELVESKSPGSDRALEGVNALRSRLGDAALLHILELWDYAGVQL
jgi:hypothetical protein